MNHRRRIDALCCPFREIGLPILLFAIVAALIRAMY